MPFDLSAMKKTIQENNNRFTAAHIRGDGALIDNMFARDATVMPPGSEPVIGREAISKLTVEYMSYGISEFKEETTDFYGNEDVLVDQGGLSTLSRSMGSRRVSIW